MEQSSPPTAAARKAALHLVEEWAGGPVQEAVDGSAPLGTNGNLVHRVAGFAAAQVREAVREERGRLAEVITVLLYLWTRDSSAPDANDDEKIMQMLTTSGGIFSDHAREVKVRSLVARAALRREEEKG